MHNTLCSFPYHIENWPSSPIQSKRSNIRRETSFQFSLDVDVCLLGQPSFASKLLDWLYDVQENLTLQIWIQNCSDAELLAHHNETFLQDLAFIQEKNTQEKNIDILNILEEFSQRHQHLISQKTKETSNKELSNKELSSKESRISQNKRQQKKSKLDDTSSESRVIAKVIVELKEEAIQSTNQWENDINVLLKMVNPKQQWLASRVLNHEDYMEYIQDMTQSIIQNIQEEITKKASTISDNTTSKSTTSKSTKENKATVGRARKKKGYSNSADMLQQKDSMEEVLQSIREIPSIHASSSSLWKEGMILHVMEGNDDESEFNSKTLRQMLYMLTQCDAPTALVLSFAFSWQEKEDVKMPSYTRNMPPHHRRHMHMYVQRKKNMHMFRKEIYAVGLLFYPKTPYPVCFVNLYFVLS